MSSSKKEPTSAVIVGAGCRGHGYALYAREFPEEFKIVGVAEPRESRRLKEKNIHDIPDENLFSDWKDLVKKDRIADCAIVATVDQHHKEPTIALAKLGYHILLEKPMADALWSVNETMEAIGVPPPKGFETGAVNLAGIVFVTRGSWHSAKDEQQILHERKNLVCCNKNLSDAAPLVELHSNMTMAALGDMSMQTTAEDCKEIVSTCKENGVILVVCHVLRYTPWVKKIKELIESGCIGEVTHIQHKEPIGSWHFAHSYVRGNWRNENESTFSLLAKCCHDVDLIQYWMDKKCTKISSFGSLLHFTEENKPKGAASRCLDCPAKIESCCPYSAKRLYIDSVKMGNRGWPVSVLADVPDIESITEALKTGPYGRCVYESDNNVVSNQVVNFQYEGGQTAALTMIAFTEKICSREVNVYGTKGEIQCYNENIILTDFLTHHQKRIPLENDSDLPRCLSGHGGADFHTVHSFVQAVRAENPSMILTGPDDTLRSHLLVFEAEKSRKENRVIDL